MMHVSPPGLCTDCVLKARAMAEQAVDRHIVKSCRHGGNSTVAICFVADGRIISFDLRGPLGTDEALVSMLEMVVKQLTDHGVMATSALVN